MPIRVALLLTVICLIHPPWLGDGNGFVAGFAKHAWLWEDLTTMKELHINVAGLLCEVLAVWLTYAALRKQ